MTHFLVALGEVIQETADAGANQPEPGFWRKVYTFLVDILSFSVAEIRVLDVLILILCFVTAFFLNRLIVVRIPRWVDAIHRKFEEKKLKREKEEAELAASEAENDENKERDRIRVPENKEKKEENKFGISSFMVMDAIFKSLHRPLKYLLYTLALDIAIRAMHTPEWAKGIHDLLLNLLHAALMLWLVWYIVKVTNRLTELFVASASQTESKLDDMLVPLISSVVKFLVIFAGAMLVLQALGYHVESLVASLGIGGAALALASKDTLANLFGAFVVFFDKPFEIGDWVAVNGVEGEVEEIRLRTTLIRTWENSVVTLPNSVLSTSNINNFERRHYRKMDCDFGVLYSTTSDQIEQIVNEIRAHLAQYAVKDPSNIQPGEIYAPNYYVGFKGFGDSSLDIEVTAFTINAGKSVHMAQRQQFLLEIMRIVERAGTGFAFPTRTLEWAPGMKPQMMSARAAELEMKNNNR